MIQVDHNKMAESDHIERQMPFNVYTNEDLCNHWRKKVHMEIIDLGIYRLKYRERRNLEAIIGNSQMCASVQVSNKQVKIQRRTLEDHRIQNGTVVHIT